jgi:hypothetical protein
MGDWGMGGSLSAFKVRLLPLGLAALLGFCGGMAAEFLQGSPARKELQDKLCVAEMERDTLRWQIRGLFQQVAGPSKQPVSPDSPAPPDNLKD